MELLEIYNDEGKPTGKTVVRGDKNLHLDDNEHIAVGVIFIENSNHEYLIQKTSKEKGGYYSSTGGHITKGETPMSSILREIKEELGIEVKEDEVRSLGFINNGIPLMFLFYMKKDINIEDIIVQKEEVSYVEYKTKEEIENLINNNLLLKSHGILFHELLKNNLST